MAIITRLYRVTFESGARLLLCGPPAAIREGLEDDPVYQDEEHEIPDRVKSIWFHSFSIEVEGKQPIRLTTSASRDWVREGRCVGRCECRPIINERSQSVWIGGEDDCPVHGFGGDDESITEEKA